MISNLFREITSTIVQVKSLEAAEMIKLINNHIEMLVLDLLMNSN